MRIRKAIGGTLMTLAMCPMCVDLGASEASAWQLIAAMLIGAALFVAGALIGGVLYAE